ncbi:hypothetical protein BGZ76_006793 [Entomortierella beljakovae]|nr:hypothetical protein BGZ76_006793 [Entomortierella beljakovae]
MLQKHIVLEDVIKHARKSSVHHMIGKGNKYNFPYGSRYTTDEIPKFKLPDGPTAAPAAYQLIHDELDTDGRPNMNLASFVHTWMEPEADKLVMENINKNLADCDEYPATVRIHGRCVSMIGELWHSNGAVGTSTVGSSEAVALGGLAMKKRWQAKRRAEGKDVHTPNIIMGANAQVALEKFGRYFDVECRLIPVSKESNHCLNIQKAAEACDENTIGVYVILGSTYTGHFEDVEGMSKLLDKIQEEKGWDIPIHVDAASGGFVAPFSFPKLNWDFRNPRVKSINASGHKYGLSYVGVGWVLWKSEEYLPSDLVFTLKYLGAEEQTYTINFSRPACFIIAQYYNFLRLGKSGYRAIMENDLSNARFLSYALEDTGLYDVVSDTHRPKGVVGWDKKVPVEERGKIKEFNEALPVVSFKFSESFKKENPHVKQSSVSVLLRSRGWIIPNYPLPEGELDVEILRVVVRESFSNDLIDILMEDIIWSTETLAASGDTDLTILAQKYDAVKTAQAVDIQTDKTFERQC